MVTEIREYKFGIPTRADVEDPAYQEAVRLAEINNRIHYFKWPTSTVLLHNHVVDSLRQSGADVSRAEEVYQEGTYKRNLARLNPYFVQAASLSSLASYQQAILEATPYLKDDETRLESSKRVVNLPEGVKEKEARLPWNGGMPGWRYTYHPRKLLLQELTSLREDIQQALRPDQDSIKQIHNLWIALDSHDKSAAKSLLEHTLSIPMEKGILDFERDEHTEAGKLTKLHREIAQRSDVYVEFNTIYLQVKKENGSDGFPFQYIVDPQYRYEGYSLAMRTQARDEILDQLRQKGKLVINGILITVEGNNCSTDHRLPFWVVNLLAHPVAMAGDRRKAEDWAVEERQLVEDYRVLSLREALKVPLHPFVTRMTSVYYDFEGNDDAIADDVLYKLRPADWRIVHPQN